MDPTDYNELLDRNIQKEYRKVDKKVVAEAENEHKNIVNQLGLQERVFKTTDQEAFITLTFIITSNVGS